MQSKAQKLSTKEYSARSIKERAVLLSSLFPGSSRPPAPLPESQVVYCDHFALRLTDCCMFDAMHDGSAFNTESTVVFLLQSILCSVSFGRGWKINTNLWSSWYLIQFESLFPPEGVQRNIEAHGNTFTEFNNKPCMPCTFMQWATWAINPSAHIEPRFETIN